LSESIEHGENYLLVNNRKIPVINQPDICGNIWDELNVNVVIDCSGAYLSKEKAMKHIYAGAEKVLLSAPAGVDVPTVVFGVNEDILKPEDKIISAASCSTNALAPMVQALNNYAEILSGTMTVVHGFTATQMLVDSPQKKGNLRRSRAAGSNIIPTTAEAAKAVGLVIPSLNGKLIGSAIRVPVIAGCLINFVAEIRKELVSVKELNEVMKNASSEIFGYTEEEYVSSDIIGTRHASIFDATQTMINQTSPCTHQLRIASWFDNENSFASQMVRCLKYIIQ
jgi:glyceraldehyde 3-phosphate dehydrogenase